MPRMTFSAAAPLLAALALLAPGRAVAGPPEGASGKMVLDEVGDGLRRYRAEKDDGKRVAWLERLAPSRDPRVALLTWEYPSDELTPSQYIALRRLLVRYYVPSGSPFRELEDWWRQNEAELRRRAKHLPQ